ncbi:MAG TPA: NAD(P)/FAD-dependent oxidoreductase [Candidatus Dormibacteraeota bacterium]|jgi:2-polyprenyl-6-methoxyphenol hydroxylase-like FAD-dependent oxidoreductase|nr:NAD(P)/FAD-dependent oxidoreductase [Candidatus Dormibacteraeota bacterium]
MSKRRLHVVIVGGGIGGLCLAQGLRRAGVSVAVYERDGTATGREQGYRVHIDPTGSRALHACLPPSLWNTFVATAGDPGTAGFGFLTERLEPLVVVEDEIFRGGLTDPAQGHHAVSRVTLRQILLAGLEGVVHFGKEFTGYEVQSDGRVRATFTDGTAAVGDVLVGADGGASRVRGQYLPDVRRVEVGATGIGGRLDLNDLTRSWLPSRLTGGMNVILGPRDFLFTAVFNRRRSRAEALALIGDEVRAAGLDPDALLAHLEQRDYILWAFITNSDACPTGASGPELQRLVSGRMRGWDPDLRTLIADTQPGDINAFPFRTSVRPKPWPSTNVTLLGDAIHSMTPAGGVGANTALRDALVLGEALASANRGNTDLVPAINDYESQMLKYAFKAVDRSLGNARQALGGRFSRVGARSFFRLCGALPALRRAVFSDTWTERSNEAA